MGEATCPLHKAIFTAAVKYARATRLNGKLGDTTYVPSEHCGCYQAIICNFMKLHLQRERIFF